MSSGFQWVIDNAAQISVDKRKVVGQTITRTGVVRSVDRGVGAWRIEVSMPAGMVWSEVRQNIASIDLYDRHTPMTVNFNNSGYSWLFKYQGNSVNYTGFIGNFTTGSSSFTLTTSPTTSSGYKFRAGDIIQVGAAGNVYQVVSDVPYNSNTVTVHTSVAESGSQALNVGPNANWNLICTQLPIYATMSLSTIA